MKANPTSIQARLRLPGTAALANSSHDTPKVMQPPNPLRRILTGLAAALTMGLFVTPTSAQEMISNGSLEDGVPAPSAASGQITVAAGNTANLPGWTASTTMGWYFKYTAWGMTPPVGAGERLFNLNSPTGTYTLSQSFAVTAGDTYTVSYYEKRRGGGGYMDTTVSVAAGMVSGASGSPVAVAAGPAASIVQATAANAAWTLHSFTFTPDTTTTATITFGNHYGGGQGDNDGVFLDKVSVLGPATLTSTTTTLARNSGTVTPSTYGDSLSFDVTLDPTTATGTVDLYDGGASGTLIGTGTLLDGTCTITTTTLAVGTHDNIVAVYAGDTTYAGSTSIALDPAQVVNSGGATALLFTTPPSGAQPGEVWATQPTVKLLDAGGNIADSSASITLEITTSTPASGGPGTLIGTKTVTAVNGVATFSGLSIDTAGVGYRLTATSADLTPADSALFTISSGTVLYDSADCSGQFPRTTLDFAPIAGHVYTLSFSMNNPADTVVNCLIGLSPYALADNTYDADTLIDGFWNSSGGSVSRQYNGGGSGDAFTPAGSGNGYRGPYGKLDSNFEVVLDTTSSPWKTSTSMSSCLGTVSGPVYDALGTAKSVQVWVRDPGNGIYPTISNFRLTDTSFIGSTPSTTTLARSPGTLTPSAYGDSLSFDVKVSGGGTPSPSGTVTLQAGATPLGSGTLTPSGTDGICTITTSTLAVTHGPIVAVFGGDPTYAPSISSALDPDQIVILAPLALPVTTDVNLWLDASQLTGLIDGDPVATWPDMSGMGNYAAKTSGSPTYKTGVLNGKPVVRFVRANGDAFTTPDLSSQFPSAATVFIVATINTGLQFYTLVYTNANADEWWRYDGNGNSYPAVFRSPRVEGYCAMPDSGSHIFAISSSSSSWQMWIDGAAQGDAGGSYNAGGVHVIGSGSNGGTLDGDIAEIIEFSRALNPTEMTQMNAYLTTKYGLGGTTPTYDDWATTNGVTGGINGDSNNDGVQNGVAYFMDDTGPISNPGISGNTVTWPNGGNIPNTEYGADKQFVIETSTDLVNWTPVAIGDLTTNTSGPGGELSYTLPEGVEGGKIFARLLVTPN